MSAGSPEQDMPQAFSEYGVPFEKLPVEAEVLEGSNRVMTGLVNLDLGKFVTVWAFDDYEYQVVDK